MEWNPKNIFYLGHIFGIRDKNFGCAVAHENQKFITKSWDMRYNWLRDRIAQAQFNVKWKAGIHNLADYFTKHHPPKHHQIKRADYILKGY